jgi:hypothetical protein
MKGIGGIGYLLVFILASLNYWNALVVVIVVSSVLFIIGFVYKKISKQYACPPPPVSPVSNKLALLSEPDVVYDSTGYCDINPVFAKNSEGYPPDWRERKRRCIERDGGKCRICQSQIRLHVHHVKPISFGGNNSLQNLITLCSKCHFLQEYYLHHELVKHNIIANIRYWVDSYTTKGGVTVKGHHRKTGRRGNFWKYVRRKRES